MDVNNPDERVRVQGPMHVERTGVFEMCISSCSIHRVEATDWVKHRNTCRRQV